MRGGEEEEGRSGENLLEGEQLMGEETREEEREGGRLATALSLPPKFKGIFQLSLSRSVASTRREASEHLKGERGGG